MNFNRFYCGFTGFYWVLLGSTDLFFLETGSAEVSDPVCTGCDWNFGTAFRLCVCVLGVVAFEQLHASLRGLPRSGGAAVPVPLQPRLHPHPAGVAARGRHRFGRPANAENRKWRLRATVSGVPGAVDADAVHHGRPLVAAPRRGRADGRRRRRPGRRQHPRARHGLGAAHARTALQPGG